MKINTTITDNIANPRFADAVCGRLRDFSVLPATAIVSIN